MRVRPAVPGDAAAIADIRTAEIRDGTALWRTRPESPGHMSDWMLARAAAGDPVLVADTEDTGTVGYATYTQFRAGEGYALSVEHSVYVARHARGRGVATALVQALIARARAEGRTTMIAGVSGDQPASLALHAKLGFREVGRLPGVGRKFGRSLDLVLMMLALDGRA